MRRQPNSARSARGPLGVIRARRTGELKEALRLWAAEFNRRARSAVKHTRRAKVAKDAPPGGV